MKKKKSTKYNLTSGRLILSKRLLSCPIVKTIVRLIIDFELYAISLFSHAEVTSPLVDRGCRTFIDT